MQLKIYNSSSMPNVINKVKTLIDTFEADLIENVNRENVVVTIPYSSAYANINYAYIPEFERYYFVSVDCINGQRLRLNAQAQIIIQLYVMT